MRVDAGYAFRRKGSRIESSPCNFVLPDGLNCTAEGVRLRKRGRLWEMFCDEHFDTKGRVSEPPDSDA